MKLLLLLLASVCLHGQTTDAFNWQARWGNYVGGLHDWKSIASIAGETAFDQSFRTPQCWRREVCFPNRFSEGLTRRTARTTTELGVGALLGEDLRRTPSGLNGFRRRFLYAVGHAALDKGRDGAWHPAYSRYAGTFVGIGVSAAWRRRPLSAERLIDGYGWAATSYLQDSLWTEFEPDMKRAASRVLNRIRHHETFAPIDPTTVAPLP